jgi:hypothetical protein
VIGGREGIISKVIMLVNAMLPAVTPLIVRTIGPRACEARTVPRNRLVVGSKVSQGAFGRVEMYWGLSSDLLRKPRTGKSST